MMALQQPDRSPPPFILADLLLVCRFGLFAHQLIPLTELVRPEMEKVCIANDLIQQDRRPWRKLRGKNALPDGVDDRPAYPRPCQKNFRDPGAPLFMARGIACQISDVMKPGRDIHYKKIGIIQLIMLCDHRSFLHYLLRVKTVMIK